MQLRSSRKAAVAPASFSATPGVRPGGKRPACPDPGRRKPRAVPPILRARKRNPSARVDDRIDGRYLEVHQSLLTLLATQAPVATDLRLISALLHLMKCVERMGDQCVNVAKVIPLTGHAPPRDDVIIRDNKRVDIVDTDLSYLRLFSGNRYSDSLF